MFLVLEPFVAEVKELRKLIKAEKSKTITKSHLREKAKSLSRKWFSELSPKIESQRQIEVQVINKYSDCFRDLLRITGPSNLRSRYESILALILKDFNKDLVHPHYEQPKTSQSLVLLSNIFSNLPLEEDDYLREATGCAQKGFLKGSVVLGWCAAIDRVHRKIEEIGFSKFNITSVEMANQQKGRFKRFNQIQNVQSLSELREVFDAIVLWIIEGMGLIDSNQHTRLRSCFDMRCQSAHPGDAPITEFNLLSFYSDIKEIVLENDKFSVGKTTNSQGSEVTIEGKGDGVR